MVNNKLIEDISVFGHYKKDEDVVTSALLHIFRRGGEELIYWFLQELDADIQSKGFRIYTQKKGGKSSSIPDGYICNSPIQIYIESKRNAAKIDIKQLNEHRKNIELTGDTFLLYITNHKERPKELDEKELWTNWRNVLDILKRFIYSLDGFTRDEVLIFLYEEFEKLLDRFVFLVTRKSGVNGLVQNTSADINQRVIIVGGHWGEYVALQHAFYACQPHRFFLPARYLAFYHQNRIKYLFEIIDVPIESVDLDESNVKIQDKPRYFNDTDKEYIQLQKGDKKRLRKFFQLKYVQELSPEIQNDTTDRNNKLCAFTQKQRYTTLDKILRATKTSEL